MNWSNIPREKIEALKAYAENDAELDTIEALAAAGSVRGAAAHLGLSCHKNTGYRIKRVLVRAEKAGVSPRMESMHHPMPLGQELRGISELRRGDGELVLRWTKTQKDAEQIAEMLKAKYESYAETIPRARPVLAGPKNTADLLVMFSLFDFHLGMYAAALDGERGWDLESAERMFYGWLRYSVAKAPKATKAILVNGGDFRHFDGRKPVTPSSGHLLHHAGVWREICKRSVTMQRWAVKLLLHHFEHVDIVELSGNHDFGSSDLNREWLRAHYENEPRVSVNEGDGPLFAHQFGDVGLFFAHGNQLRPEDCPAKFPARFPKLFGDTRHWYAHVGDKHHQKEVVSKDINKMVVYQHPNMASPDEWTREGHWMSRRAAHVFTYHPKLGELDRYTVTPAMAMEFSQ